MGRDADIRIGTEDRERAVELLSAHFAAGRIDVGEYEQRCGAATTARTRGEVSALFDDLPAPHPDYDPDDSPDEPEIVPAAPTGVLQRSVKRRTNNWLIGGFVAVGIGSVVAVTAITGSWWFLGPAVLIALVLVMVAS